MARAKAKTEPKAKGKGGRPKKVIDYDTVEKLAGLMCTQEEISHYLDISVRTLQRDAEFCRVYKKGMDKGKMSLRRLQYKKAEAGNATMQIWLGKQYLGQKDKVENSGKTTVTQRHDFSHLSKAEIKKLLKDED